MDKLDESENVSAFLLIANKIINSKLKALLPNVFVQDKVVLEFAVEPLLKEFGPLKTTDVISKLMFALGKVSLETYATIGLYEQIGNYAKDLPKKIKFSDEMVLDFIKNQQVLTSSQLNYYLESINQLKFSSFESYSVTRYEALIRILLKLSCDMLLKKLEEEINP